MTILHSLFFRLSPSGRYRVSTCVQSVQRNLQACKQRSYARTRTFLPFLVAPLRDYNCTSTCYLVPLYKTQTSKEIFLFLTSLDFLKLNVILLLVRVRVGTSWYCFLPRSTLSLSRERLSRQSGIVPQRVLRRNCSFSTFYCALHQHATWHCTRQQGLHVN